MTETFGHKKCTFVCYAQSMPCATPRSRPGPGAITHGYHRRPVMDHAARKQCAFGRIMRQLGRGLVSAESPLSVRHSTRGARPIHGALPATPPESQRAARASI